MSDTAASAAASMSSAVGAAAQVPSASSGGFLRSAASLFTDYPTELAAVGGVLLLYPLAKALYDSYVPSNTILELDLDTLALVHTEPSPLKKMLNPGEMSMKSLVLALERARKDDKIRGIIVRLGNGNLNNWTMARLQEVRDGIARLREANKITVAYAETFDEGRAVSGVGAYYLASAFEHIYLAPCGSMTLLDYSVESPFVRNLLSKLGFEAVFFARKQYKNAVNQLTHDHYTEPHREALQQLLASVRDQTIQGISRGLGIDAVRVEDALRDGPFTAPQALQRGLVHGLKYRDQVYAEVAQLVGVKGPENLRLLFVSAYATKRGYAHINGRNKVAYINCVGPITRGSSEQDWTGTRSSIGSDTTCRAIRAAAKDRKVRAILLHIDSGGGSYIASDHIAREIERARKESGKKVIVAMENVAASGGYYIAMNANKIVAQPGTITGSIGVFLGKFQTEEFWNKVGVTWDNIKFSENSTLFSGLHRLDQHGTKYMNDVADFIYDDFTAKVAIGRNMSRDRVEAAAKGRIWTGVDAKEKGLVDELGGLVKAVEVTKAELGLSEKDTIALVSYPKHRSFFESLAPAKNSLEQDAHGVNAFDPSGLVTSSNSLPLAQCFRAMANTQLFGSTVATPLMLQALARSQLGAGAGGMVTHSLIPTCTSDAGLQIQPLSADHMLGPWAQQS